MTSAPGRKNRNIYDDTRYLSGSGAATGAITGDVAQGAGYGGIYGGTQTGINAEREKQRVFTRCLRGRGYRVLNY